MSKMSQPGEPEYLGVQITMKLFVGISWRPLASISLLIVDNQFRRLQGNSVGVVTGPRSD